MVAACPVKIKQKQIELHRNFILKNILFTQGNVLKNSGWGGNKNLHFVKVLLKMFIMQQPAHSDRVTTGCHQRMVFR